MSERNGTVAECNALTGKEKERVAKSPGLGVRQRCQGGRGAKADNRERLAHMVFLVHPLRSCRALPLQHVVFLAQPLTAAKVGPPALLLPRHHIHAAARRQRQHEVRSETALAQQDIAALEAVQQLAANKAGSHVCLPLYGPIATPHKAAVAKNMSTAIRRMGKPTPAFCGTVKGSEVFDFP